jgi:hypothetical protein
MRKNSFNPTYPKLYDSFTSLGKRHRYSPRRVRTSRFHESYLRNYAAIAMNVYVQEEKADTLKQSNSNGVIFSFVSISSLDLLQDWMIYRVVTRRPREER